MPRARFTPAEVVQLTLEFYRRNYIEGLFPSSGVIRSPDYTMEQLVEVARLLGEHHDFRGDVHLTIPAADEPPIARAGRYADRASVHLEPATAASLAALAPDTGRPRSAARWARSSARRDTSTSRSNRSCAGRRAPAHRERFPVCADSADREGLLRAPARADPAFAKRPALAAQ